MRYILIWVLTVEVLGLACLPLLRAFFANRRDAAMLSRPVGLVLVAYLGWALSLSRSIGFERGTLLLALVLVGTASYLVSRAARRAGGPSAVPPPFFGAEEMRAALSFWIPAAIFMLIRAAQPEVLGAEKFMDLAFFNSLTRFGDMPPADPWMSGLTINYYYWGYLLAAVLAKLSQVPTFVSYNLAIATFAGYTFAAAACLALRLSGGRTAAGVWAGIGTVFAGNLTGALDAWYAPFAREFDYWHASRVIASGNTINEFPFFTFFHADLHPHLAAFPFYIAAFVVAHRYLQIPQEPLPSPWKVSDLLRKAWPPLLLALLAGTARAANNWNLPAMGLLLVFTCVFRTTGGRRLPSLADALWGAMAGVGMLLLSLLLWFPYSRSYALQQNGLGRTTMTSDLVEFLGVWAILLAAGYVGFLAAPGSEEDEASRRRGDLPVALFAGACLLAGFATKAPALIAILPLGLLGLRLALRSARSPEGNPEDLYTAFLIVLAVAMIAGCEFIYFKDSYGQALQRMNTIFKFYHQAWPLLAVGVAVLAERAWRNAAASSPAVRITLTAAMALALFYPVEAAASRLRQHEGAFSLDMRAALARRSSGDAAAIEWLVGHAPERSVILEATGDPYSEFARVSSHTGIPTVIGWANHEGLWRSNDPEVAQRSAAVRAFYTAADPRTAATVLQRYRVTHVVLGDMERRSYSTAGNVASYPFLAPVKTGDTVVYRVVPAQ